VQSGRRYVSSCVGAIAVILVLSCSPARAETRVILLRGWFGVFSTGLDAIADALKAKGIHAEVAGHLQWKTAAEEIRRERAQGKTDAIVLVGHSQGANNVIDMARLLEAQNVPVALLVIATLQHIPDTDRPADMIAAYLNAMCSGSYLALSHYGPDTQLAVAYQLFDQMQLGRRPDVSLRDRTSLARLFTGLEFVEPGIVPIVAWRPDPDDDLGNHWERLPINAGLARKP